MDTNTKRPRSGPLTDAEWNAEKQAMEILDTSLAGRCILVRDVSPWKAGKLGYTSKDSVIHVAMNHEYYNYLNRDEASVFRFGVNTHEALHQVFTDFDTFYAIAEAVPGEFEREMFAKLFNLIEDPAIENFADQVVGGVALDALYFTIEKVYEHAQPVSGPQNHGQPLEEYLDALIQFGDRGIIKGGFSSEVAREYFNRTAPTIYRVVNEPDGAERVRLALMVYQEAKGLWVNQPPSKVKQAFLGVEGRYAKHKAEGSGSGKALRKAEDARNGRRKKEMEKQSVKEEEAVLKDAGLMPDGQEEKGGDKGKDKEKNGQGKAAGGDDGQESALPEGRTPPDVDDGNGDDGPVFQYGPDIAERFAEAIERLSLGGSGSAPDDNSELPEFYHKTIQRGHKQFSGVKEKNIVASAENVLDNSNDIFNAAAWIAGALSTQLKKIFMDDRGGKLYTQRGKVSMKRAASGRATTRMFERRILPGDKADMCLMLLVDLSGSMRGIKDVAAKTAAIALCETFAYLKIPAYCMGFQYIHGFDAYQTHFVRWRNTAEERLSILSAEPNGNNFDSYSIRYATEALRGCPEKHKLMCVISDGLPSHYFTGDDGIRENAAAIQDARALGTEVFGVAIAAGNAATFTQMYGRDYFINITKPDDMADQAADLIKTVVKGW